MAKKFQPRCPICGCIGDVALGDYCKKHHPNADDDDKHTLDDFHEKAGITREFITEGGFGIISDKFGMER